MSRACAAVVLVATVAVCGACAAKQSTVVVLLPDREEGTVGRAVVENTAGGVDLVSGRDATRVRTEERPGAVNTMSDAEVQRIFGAALAALPPAARRFVLNFRFESDELTDEARAVVPEILRVVRESAFANVVVTGHTDTMGTPSANHELGLKRAITIRNLLVSAGLDPRQIEVTSLGETDPLVRTADETAEPRNRRVDITVR
jgi:outer membrane protein OmpA-like peptidoglycan-associated protein